MRDAATAFDELLAANARYAEDFGLGHLEARAAAGLAVITCFDSRIEPLQMLGLEPGDAKILRTAGAGVNDDVLRSLELATTALGVDRIAVIPHTECAAPGVSTQTLVDDVQRILDHPGIGDHVVVTGMRYDVKSGRLEQLVPPRRA